MRTILLIDANSIIHRCFHALPPLTTPSGEPIQAVYGLSNILLKVWREEGPVYVAAFFDRPEPTFREKIYVEYKAQRPATPDTLVPQIIEAHQLLQYFGVKAFESPGYEADDFIATAADRFSKEPNVRVVILTGDLDTLQLVRGSKLVVRTFKKGISDTFTYDEDAVRSRYGLEPSQLVDYKALVGDQSDNIKGVPGVGSKTASELLSRFRTLENLYRHLDDDPKVKKRLAGTEAQAALAKKLVTLDRNAPLPVESVEELPFSPDLTRLREYFVRLGFESLLKRSEEHTSELQSPILISRMPSSA